MLIRSLLMGNRPLPTDLEILNRIYDRYYDAFADWDVDPSIRKNKNFIPIDIPLIAQQLGVNADVVFGRLYYSLQKRHGFRNEDKTLVPFFTRELEEGKNHINFPLLSAVLAELRDQHVTQTANRTLSIFSLSISVIALIKSFW
jgi:hypothetical protein